jgi:acyl carrier protein
MIDERLLRVFREIFADDALTVTSATTSADVTGWDSLAHINLIYAIESEFGIEVEDERLASFENVGQLWAYIEERRQPAGQA